MNKMNENSFENSSKKPEIISVAGYEVQPRLYEILDQRNSKKLPKFRRPKQQIVKEMSTIIKKTLEHLDKNLYHSFNRLLNVTIRRRLCILLEENGVEVDIDTVGIPSFMSGSIHEMYRKQYTSESDDDLLESILELIDDSMWELRGSQSKDEENCLSCNVRRHDGTPCMASKPKVITVENKTKIKKKKSEKNKIQVTPVVNVINQNVKLKKNTLASQFEQFRLKMKMEEIQISRNQNQNMKIDKIPNFQNQNVKKKVDEIRNTQNQNQSVNMKVYEIQNSQNQNQNMKMKIHEIQNFQNQNQNVKKKVDEIRNSQNQNQSVKIKIDEIPNSQNQNQSVKTKIDEIPNSQNKKQGVLVNNKQNTVLQPKVVTKKMYICQPDRGPQISDKPTNKSQKQNTVPQAKVEKKMYICQPDRGPQSSDKQTNKSENTQQKPIAPLPKIQPISNLSPKIHDTNKITLNSRPNLKLIELVNKEQTNTQSEVQIEELKSVPLVENQQIMKQKDNLQEDTAQCNASDLQTNQEITWSAKILDDDDQETSNPPTVISQFLAQQNTAPQFMNQQNIPPQFINELDVNQQKMVAQFIHQQNMVPQFVPQHSINEQNVNTPSNMLPQFVAQQNIYTSNVEPNIVTCNMVPQFASNIIPQFVNQQNVYQNLSADFLIHQNQMGYPNMGLSTIVPVSYQLGNECYIQYGCPPNSIAILGDLKQETGLKQTDLGNLNVTIPNTECKRKADEDLKRFDKKSKLSNKLEHKHSQDEFEGQPFFDDKIKPTKPNKRKCSNEHEHEHIKKSKPIFDPKYCKVSKPDTSCKKLITEHNTTVRSHEKDYILRTDYKIVKTSARNENESNITPDLKDNQKCSKLFAEYLKQWNEENNLQSTAKRKHDETSDDKYKKQRVENELNDTTQIRQVFEKHVEPRLDTSYKTKENSNYSNQSVDTSNLDATNASDCTLVLENDEDWSWKEDYTDWN